MRRETAVDFPGRRHEDVRRQLTLPRERIKGGDLTPGRRIRPAWSASARTVKREARGTSVILLTGWGAQLRAEQEIPEGVDWLLSKPLQIAELRRALAELAGGGSDDGSAPWRDGAIRA